MARPCKDRKISDNLEVCYFKPIGKDEASLDRVELHIDELQAIKLSNLDGYSNKDGAEAMGVSAPTFNRILKKANKKIADAIINGKGIKICD